MVFVLLLFSFASADKLDDAISRMYDNGLTIHAGQMTYKADSWLRRDEAAKFYVNFSKLLGKTTYVKTASQCVFSDINDSWSDLKDVVVESCRLGLFQGSKGKFTPKSQLTNAQAITVLVRLLAGNQSEAWQSHRANNYYTKANELGILQNVSMNSKDSIATRGNVGVIIYNSRDITISEDIVSANKMTFDQWIDAINSICKRYTNEWLPNSTRGADAKFINTKLQDVRDNWQQLVNTYINEANSKLNESWLTNSNKCRYSRLIDALQNQQWYMRSYTTANWITTIGIDFISYQDDVSKIAYDWAPRLDVMKNTSTKVRYYQLSSNPQLQTVDSNWTKKYISNFTSWTNQFCNNETIYTTDWWDTNRNENNIYCVRSGLPSNNSTVATFSFDSIGKLQKIDLNRRHLSLAG